MFVDVLYYLCLMPGCEVNVGIKTHDICGYIEHLLFAELCRSSQQMPQDGDKALKQRGLTSDQHHASSVAHDHEPVLH